MRQLVREIYKTMFINFGHKPVAEQSHTTTHLHFTKKCEKLAQSEIFQDNTGCIVLATTKQHRPQTNKIAVKWHHFKEQIHNGSCKITKAASALN